MKLGICVGLDKAAVAAEIGFEYLESNLGQIKKSEVSYLRELRKAVDNFGVKFEATNCFFPGDIHIVGDSASLDEIREYTCRAFDNAKILGVETCVLGSGRSREIPDGYDREKGYAQALDALRVIGEEAKQRDIRVAIEPLNHKETNVFNTVRESTDVCRTLGLDTVCVLADIYHMVMEDEDYSALAYAGDKLIHVHLSNPLGLGDTGTAKRIYPAEGDGYDYAPFIDGLKAANYDGRISLEAGCNCFEEDAAKGLAMMKKLFR